MAGRKHSKKRVKRAVRRAALALMTALCILTAMNLAWDAIMHRELFSFIGDPERLWLSIMTALLIPLVACSSAFKAKQHRANQAPKIKRSSEE